MGLRSGGDYEQDNGQADEMVMKLKIKLILIEHSHIKMSQINYNYFNCNYRWICSEEVTVLD